jgi:hypothetical protein
VELDELASAVGPRGSENIQVFCRIRPLNSREQKASCRTIVKGDEHDRVLLQKASKTQAYAFDGVLPEDTTQAEIFHRVGKPIADAVVKGFNGTVFAYGQTGECCALRSARSTPPADAIVGSLRQMSYHSAQ